MAIFDLFHLYNSLKKEDKIRLRDTLMLECDWSYPTFYNKVKNNSLTKPEIAVINSIVKKLFN